MNLREQILMEAGYRCAVPTCRALTPLDAHHIVELESGGRDEAANLICLCPNCHTRYHREGIPSQAAIRVYKIRLQELTRAVDREAIDLLLYLFPERSLAVSGDKVADVAALFNTGYLEAREGGTGQFSDLRATPAPHYRIALTERGRDFVRAWQNGDLQDVRKS